MIIVFVGLRKDYCRNIIEEILQLLLRAMVKFHKVLNGTKVFARGCSGRNLKNFSKLARKSLCWSPFISKLQPGIAYKTKT